LISHCVAHWRTGKEYEREKRRESPAKEERDATNAMEEGGAEGGEEKSRLSRGEERKRGDPSSKRFRSLRSLPRRGGKTPIQTIWKKKSGSSLRKSIFPPFSGEKGGGPKSSLSPGKRSLRSQEEIKKKRRKKERDFPRWRRGGKALLPPDGREKMWRGRKGKTMPVLEEKGALSQGKVNKLQGRGKGGMGLYTTYSMGGGENRRLYLL